MKHYGEEAWLDFARRLLPADEMARMQAHLQECHPCGEMNRIWTTVWELVTRDLAYQPDHSLVDLVNAAYARRSWQRAPAEAFEFATLLFDSFALGGATAGFRSTSAAPRHLLYRTGPLTIDVRLASYCPPSVTVAGQVLQAGAPTTTCSGAKVHLVSGESTLATTVTSEYGEFQVDVQDGPDLQILLYVTGHAPVILRLPHQLPTHHSDS